MTTFIIYRKIIILNYYLEWFLFGIIINTAFVVLYSATSKSKFAQILTPNTNYY